MKFSNLILRNFILRNGRIFASDSFYFIKFKCEESNGSKVSHSRMFYQNYREKLILLN